MDSEPMLWNVFLIIQGLYIVWVQITRGYMAISR